MRGHLTVAGVPVYPASVYRYIPSIDLYGEPDLETVRVAILEHNEKWVTPPDSVRVPDEAFDAICAEATRTYAKYR